MANLNEFEQSIVTNLQKGMSTSEIAKMLNVPRKKINNQIGGIRRKGVSIPHLKKGTKLKLKKGNLTYKKVEDNISSVSNGSYKVTKRIKGKTFQKLTKSIEEARAYRDSLMAPKQETPVVKRSYNKKPKISQVSLEEVFPNTSLTSSGAFAVVISNDAAVLNTLLNRFGVNRGI